jgi:hypothetical protein
MNNKQQIGLDLFSSPFFGPISFTMKVINQYKSKVKIVYAHSSVDLEYEINSFINTQESLNDSFEVKDIKFLNGINSNFYALIHYNILKNHQ